MSERIGNTQLGSVVRALAFLRGRELATPATFVRLTAIGGGCLALLYIATRHDSIHNFWNIAENLFLLTFVPILCLVKGGDAVRTELKEGTMEYLWTRPARRGHLFIGLYVSALMGIAATLGVCALAIVAVGFWVGALTSLATLLGFMLCLAASAASFAAISALLGAYSSHFVVLGIFYYFFVETGLGLIPTGVRNVSINAHVRDILAPAQISGETIALAPLGAGLAYVGAIGAVMLLAGTALFIRSRYIVGSSKEG